MSLDDPMAWSDECEVATEGNHFDYAYNTQSLWACTNIAGVAPEHYDDGAGYRCRVKWWIPDSDYSEGKRCEDEQHRCFHEECVNPEDLQVMANRIYEEVQTRDCVLKENSVDQECKCCCSENMEVMIDCDWVKKLDDGNFNVTDPSTIIAWSTITASASSSNDFDWSLFIGLTATVSLMLVALGWFLTWYLSPKRRGYRKDVDEDYLPPLPGSKQHYGPSAIPQTGTAINNVRDVSDSGDGSNVSSRVINSTINPQTSRPAEEILTPYADEDEAGNAV